MEVTYFMLTNNCWGEAGGGGQRFATVERLRHSTEDPLQKFINHW